MQVTETLAEGLKREFAVTLSAQDLQAKADAKLAELGKTLKIPGFRPGKIPATVLKQRYGNSVMGEALEEAVNESAARAVGERGLKPAMRPKIEIVKFEPTGDLEFKMEFELLPEIEPIDFATLTLERLVAEASDDEVSDALAKISQQRRESKPLETPRPAITGDVLIVDFLGKVDGEAFEGGAAEDFELPLGSGALIPGFEDQLVGVSVGETKLVEVTFPADYGASHLAGKAATFDVTVKEVREAVQTQIDDAFAQSLGLEGLEELRKMIRDRLSQDYGRAARSCVKRSLLDLLADQHVFPVPESMVKAEFDAIWQQVEAAAKAGQTDPDLAGKSEDEQKAEFQRISERRVRLGLLLSEVGRRNNIQVNEDELRRAVIDEARQYPGQERQVIEYYRSNPDAMASLRAPLYEEKVVDFILELAKVEERSVTPAELLAAVEAA